MVRAETPPDLLVFDVQRFCVHDGPGMRTVAFLKGCPLRCRWCQNPESLRPRQELAFSRRRCIGCSECQRACPEGAIGEGPVVDRDRCQACGRCAEACPAEALQLIGRLVSAEELLEELLADRSYFEATGGGITLSGGEPLAQAQGAARLLRLCRREGLHSLVETSGAVPWQAFAAVLDDTDHFFFDLKAGVAEQHRALTGGALEVITGNAERLVAAGAEVTFRTPIVAGQNDDDESLRGLAALLHRLGHRRLVLLPHHRGGEDKLRRLERAGPRLRATALDDARGAALSAAARLGAQGVEAVIVSGEEPEARGSQGKSAFSGRVWRLREAVQSARPTVCAERATLVTDYYADLRNRGKSAIRRRGEALRHILRSKESIIYPEELLVGCFTRHRVGGSVLPELHGVAMLEDLFAFDRRETNPLEISRADRRALALRVLPFWSTRFLALKAFDSWAERARFVTGQLRSDRYVVNESGGISHFVPDYARLLAEGTSGIAQEARRRREPAAADFYDAVLEVCTGLEELAAGYVSEALRLAETEVGRAPELEAIAAVCERVPRLPATTLREALQSLLFAQIALNLESLDNSVSPGRLDQVLLPYARADLEAGRLDEGGVRELLGCFAIKLCEIVPVFSRRLTKVHGGLFNGQVVVVGGVDSEGHDATNELTWAWLDVMDELRLRQPNFHARLHRHSPPAYARRLAAMLASGSGAPSLMNDDVVTPMLEARGMNRADARDYSPVGCVEPVSCGATFGSTDAALINLPLCLERTLGLKGGGPRLPKAEGCATMEELLYLLARQVDHLFEELLDDLGKIEVANARHHPTPLTSALLRGCLETGRDATAGGARYNASGVQPVGLVDVADSLAAIEAVVFGQRGRCTMPELVLALEADFEGREVLRGHLLRAPKFGNDDDRADRHARWLADRCAAALARRQSTRGGPYLAGYYSVTAHVAFGEVTRALPSGRRAGAPLANGLSPAGGQDRLGPTAALNSAASIDHGQRCRNGVNVNVTLDPSALGGDESGRTVAGLIRGYFARGGMQAQVNALSRSVLEEAARDPLTHPNLLIRVSGYSAYFADLSPAMQQEVLDRRAHRVR